MKRIVVAVCWCLLSTTACTSTWQYEATPGLIFVGLFMVFYDSEGPLSYQTGTPYEVPKDAIRTGEVRGDSCQHGVSIPIPFTTSSLVSFSGAKGNGSYKKALLDIKEQHPDLDGLYDVKVDIHRRAILTIYRRSCTIVVARGFKRNPHADTSELSSE